MHCHDAASGCSQDEGQAEGQAASANRFRSLVSDFSLQGPIRESPREQSNGSHTIWMRLIVRRVVGFCGFDGAAPVVGFSESHRRFKPVRGV
jgi:hypothetical protein